MSRPTTNPTKTPPRPRVEVLADADRVAALAHPLRVAILDALRTPNSASGVARVINETRQKTNYHVKALLDDLDEFSADFVLLLDACRQPPDPEDDGSVYDRVESVLAGLSARSWRLVPGTAVREEPQVAEKVAANLNTRLIINSCRNGGRAHEVGSSASRRIGRDHGGVNRRATECDVSWFLSLLVSL